MDSKSLFVTRGAVQVWIEENDSSFQLATLCKESTPVSYSLSSEVSLRDIYLNCVARKSSESVYVLIPGSQVCVAIPREKIHMWYSPDGVAPGSEPADLLATPTNLPSVLLALRTRSEQGMRLARLGPVFVALRPVMVCASLLEHQQDVQCVVSAALETVAAGSCAAIVLSGCTGSGKSFVFGQLLRRLVSSSNSSDGLCAPLLAGVAVLEAFGNCETKQNADSSRFGKYLRLKMQRDGTVLSASISTFCLERRAAAPAGDDGHECFRVFTLLLASVREGFNAPESIGVYPDLLYKGCRNQQRVAGMGSDEIRGLCAQYHELVHQLATLGLHETARTQLFRMIGAIFLLRNVTLVKKTASGLPSKEKGAVHDDATECMADSQCLAVQRAGELLGVRVGELSDLLCKKFVKSVRKEDNYFIHLTFEQARLQIAMVAETLYDSVFLWLATKHCTAAWGPGTGAKKLLIEHYVDILDFAPISEGEVNGFDQLMTNYCCEKLHKYYCSTIFRDELMWHRDGLCLDVAGEDCCCLYLLDGEAGVLSLVDEHCLLSRAGQDDHTLFQLIYSTHAQHSSNHFSRDRVSRAARARDGGGDSFCVRHHSGVVSYNTRGFMRRNKGDRLEHELCSAFEASSNVVLADIFNGLLSAEEGTAAADTPTSRWSKSKIKRTEISLMKRKVSELISDAQTTKPLFVKCIKASRSGAAGGDTLDHDSEFIAQQLHAHGVVDLITLKMRGFSETYLWEDVHAMLVANHLYHFRDLVVLRAIKGNSSASQAQRVQLAKDLFIRCQTYMQVALFWAAHPSASGVAAGSLCCLQVEAFDYILHFKKSAMKDLIYNFFFFHRQRQLLAKKLCCRRVLARFFCSMQLRRRWQRSTVALLQRFQPLKLFIRRWTLQFRVRRRRATRVLLLFLHRRDWKYRVREVLDSGRAVQTTVHQAGAVLIQRWWRGSCTRLLLHDSVVVQVRSRLRARQYRKMASRIYRNYRRYSLKNWLDEIVHAIRWDKLPLVGKLLFCDPRVSRQSAHKVNIRQQRAAGFMSLLHTAVGLHRASIVHVLLLAGADPFAFDGSRCLPASCLFEPAAPAAAPPSLQHAHTASVLLFHCPQLAAYPCRDLQLLDGADFGRHIDEFHCNIQCGQVSLSTILNNMVKLKNREVAKKKYKQHLQSTPSCSSIIDLIDPADWTSPLVLQPPAPLCTPADSTASRRAAVASEDEERTVQKQIIKASIFPRDVHLVTGEEEDEAAGIAAAAAAALAATQLEQSRREDDVACTRARLRGEHRQHRARMRQARAITSSLGWRECATGQGGRSSSGAEASAQSFNSIVGNCDLCSSSDGYGGSNKNTRSGAQLPEKHEQQVRLSSPGTPATDHVPSSSSLLQEVGVASAEQRRRAARRLELEADAALLFLARR